MLREVPSIGMSLLGGMRLGPNSAKPFWGRGLALLGTGKCVDPLSASAVLLRVWSPSLGKAVPTLYRIKCCT